MLVAVVVVSESQDGYVGLWFVEVVQSDRVPYTDNCITLQFGGQGRIKSVHDACVRWINRWHSPYQPIDQFHADLRREDAYLTDVVVLRYGKPIVFTSC